MIPDDLINKKVKQETNLRSDSIVGCTGPKRHLSFIDTAPPMAGPISMARRPYLRWPYLQESGRVFSSRSLTRLSNKCKADQFRMARARKQMSLSFVSIIKLITRLAAMQEVTLCAMQIETTRLAFPALHIMSTGSLKPSKKQRAT